MAAKTALASRTHNARTEAQSTAREHSLAAVLAGLLLAGAGIIIVMGIITGEALYTDAVYTTHDNEISDLGATRPPDSVSYQPSSTIFNTTMIVAGVMLIGASYGVHRAFGRRSVSIPMLLLGVGVLGVGIFPGNRGAIHPWFALMAFVAGGIAAVLSARVQSAPMRYVSIVLGVTTIGALVVGLLGDVTPLWDELGDGGVERWIAYPVMLWAVAFGAYLMGLRQAEMEERP